MKSISNVVCTGNSIKDTETSEQLCDFNKLFSIEGAILANVYDSKEMDRSNKRRVDRTGGGGYATTTKYRVFEGL